MTCNAQNLNVCRISAKAGFCAVRFYVVSLQRIFAAAFFTVAFFCNNLFYHLSNSISSFRRAVLPVWVIWAAHVASTSSSQTGYRAICAGTTTAFAHLKCFSTFFTNAVNKRFWLAGFKFVGTRPRAGVCFPSHMCVGASKLSATSGTSKCYMPTPLNFSLES